MVDNDGIESVFLSLFFFFSMWRKVRAHRSKSAKPFGEKVLEKRRQKARSNAGGNHGYLFGKPWLQSDTQGSNLKEEIDDRNARIRMCGTAPDK